jgi:pyrroloquinoline-quinone synthase
MSEILDQYHLLKHPFYQAWSDGTLAPEKLKTYSAEYGTFIKKIAEAWDACGYADIADVERSHAIMWADFAHSLKTKIAESPNVEEIASLNSFIDECNGDKAKALGALLAFECQQPDTVESKLKGLRSHYANLNCHETYFEVHIDDWDEPEMLKKEILALDENGVEASIEAFEKSCQHLWNALSGIHGEC